MRAFRSIACSSPVKSKAPPVDLDRTARWLSEGPRREAPVRCLAEFGRPRPQTDFLSTLSEFSKVRDEAREALVSAAVKRTYSDNELIYLQDDEANHLYFVVGGYIRLSYLMDDGAAILYAILPPGESFGELGVFENNTYCDMATAVGTTVVAGVSCRMFRSLSERHPELSAALARLVARRYRSYVMLMQNLSLKSLPARLAQALLRLVDQLGTRTVHANREVAFLGSVVTQADLGLMARGARGNVNRALKAWERAGWIAIHERSIYILQRAKLEALAQDEGS